MANLSPDVCQLQTSLLSGDQVGALVTSLKSHRPYADLKIDLHDLREQLNDLLYATGLASVNEDDFPAPPSSDEEGIATTTGEQHAYVATVFEELDNSLSSIIKLCSRSDISEYLNEVFGKVLVEVPTPSSLAVTRTVIDRARDRFLSLDDPEAPVVPGTNNPFVAHAEAVLKSINLIIRKLNVKDITLQLNAGILSALLRAGHEPYASPTIKVEPITMEVTFAEVMVHLRALQEAASRRALFERSQIRAYRPSDDELNLFLIALADVFLRVTQSDQPRSSLKAGSKTPFIHFVMDVIEPYYPPDNMTPAGMAKRWQRLKKDEH